MIGIYWDTSTDWIVVEVFKIDTAMAEASSLKFPQTEYSYKAFRPREASMQLVYEIQRALAMSKHSKPDFIFTASGPGAFTGIRISVSTARNLSQLWQIPCLGLDTLQLYRTFYIKYHPEDEVITVLRGNSERYFVGLERGTFDFSKEELNQEIYKLKSEKKNLQIYSYTSLEHEHSLFQSNYPGFTGVPLAYYWNPSFLDKLEEFSYKRLLPNYVRESYAVKP
jgi:tRNA A37 threonylcarbamoyladenosine modification protein TsaB